jgi:hypothetical protein
MADVTLIAPQSTHDGRNPIEVTVLIDRLSEAFSFTLQNQVSITGPGEFRTLPVRVISAYQFAITMYPLVVQTPATITATVRVNSMGLNLASPALVLTYGTRSLRVPSSLTCIISNLTCCAFTPLAAPTVTIAPLGQVPLPGIGLTHNGLTPIPILVTFSSVIPFFAPVLMTTTGSLETEATNLTVIEANRVFIVNALPTLAATTTFVTIFVAANAVNDRSSIASNVLNLTYGG